jgi:hypothetical protein
VATALLLQGTEVVFTRRNAMKRYLFLLVLVLTGTVLGAGIQDKQPGTMPMHDMQMMMKDCPMMLPGTTVTTSDTPDGIAIEFKTTAENVTELRSRVKQMVTMHSGMMKMMMQARPN